MDKRLKFNEPWILQRADPYVYEKDGWYYFTASVPAYDSIVLRRAKKLADLPQAEEVVIWKKHESGPMSKHIWAPELHYLEGNGTSILPVVKKRISGKSVHMCWNVRGRTHWQMHGWKKEKCSVQMGMNSRLKHSPWTQPYLRMPEIITTCGQKRLE